MWSETSGGWLTLNLYIGSNIPKLIRQSAPKYHQSADRLHKRIIYYQKGNKNERYIYEYSRMCYNIVTEMVMKKGGGC